MIELAFGESSAGGLKQAKSIKQVGGSPSDVEALTLALDIGDIIDMNNGGNARRKLLDELFAGFPGVPESIENTNRHALSRLQEAKTTLEPIRMWICAGNPEELCGLYFVCHLLLNARIPLSVVRVPVEIEKDSVIINYRHAGEITSEELGAYVAYEETISQLRHCVYANIWHELVRENAPLRAVVNGSLMGVPQDFYDFALRANMPDGEFKVAQLIGKTLGQIPGVGDRWLFLRVQAMLLSGELIMVSRANGDHPYSGVIKRNKEYLTFGKRTM